MYQPKIFQKNMAWLNKYSWWVNFLKHSPEICPFLDLWIIQAIAKNIAWNEICQFFLKYVYFNTSASLLKYWIRILYLYIFTPHSYIKLNAWINQVRTLSRGNSVYHSVFEILTSPAQSSDNLHSRSPSLFFDNR